MLDTGTVRLVILLGMFLYFAGEHSALVSFLWESGEEKREADETAKDKLPEGPPVKENRHLERMIFAAAKKSLDEENAITRRAKMMTIIQTACLPKLICELTSIAHQDQLSEVELKLLDLIRDTSLRTMAKVPSRYHFAAHMGQLIAGVEGQGCHNFYPTCPVSSVGTLDIMRNVRYALKLR